MPSSVLDIIPISSCKSHDNPRDSHSPYLHVIDEETALKKTQ